MRLPPREDGRGVRAGTPPPGCLAAASPRNREEDPRIASHHHTEALSAGNKKRHGLLLQDQGSQNLLPQRAPAPFGAVAGAAASPTWPLQSAPAGLAGVAQPAEHLFCKQVVRGSSPLASSPATQEQNGHSRTSYTRTPLPVPEARLGGAELPEGCPSGQREQTVNLPAIAYVGSNPTPSTPAARLSVGPPGSSPPRSHHSGRRFARTESGGIKG